MYVKSQRKTFNTEQI